MSQNIFITVVIPKFELCQGLSDQGMFSEIDNKWQELQNVGTAVGNLYSSQGDIQRIQNTNFIYSWKFYKFNISYV